MDAGPLPERGEGLRSIIMCHLSINCPHNVYSLLGHIRAPFEVCELQFSSAVDVVENARCEVVVLVRSNTHTAQQNTTPRIPHPRPAAHCHGSSSASHDWRNGSPTFCWQYHFWAALSSSSRIPGGSFLHLPHKSHATHIVSCRATAAFRSRFFPRLRCLRPSPEVRSVHSVPKPESTSASTAAPTLPWYHSEFFVASGAVTSAANLGSVTYQNRSRVREGSGSGLEQQQGHGPGEVWLRKDHLTAADDVMHNRGWHRLALCWSSWWLINNVERECGERALFRHLEHRALVG